VGPRAGLERRKIILRAGSQNFHTNYCPTATRCTTDLTGWPGFESGCHSDIRNGILETEMECLAVVHIYSSLTPPFHRSIASYTASSTQHAS
jgi:hypothetical protein